jgi:hypothetical protein
LYNLGYTGISLKVTGLYSIDLVQAAKTRPPTVIGCSNIYIFYRSDYQIATVVVFRIFFVSILGTGREGAVSRVFIERGIPRGTNLDKLLFCCSSIGLLKLATVDKAVSLLSFPGN